MNKTFCLILFLLVGLHTYAQTNLLPIQNQGKWGLINSNGQVVLPIKYGSIEVKESAFLIKSAQFDSIGLFSENEVINWCSSSAQVYVWSDKIFLKDNGKTILYLEGQETQHGLESFESIHPLNGSLALILKNKKYGLIDSALQVVFPIQYDTIIVYKKCYLTRQENEQTIFSKDGQKVMNIPLNTRLHSEWWPLVVLETPSKGLQLIDPSTGVASSAFAKDILQSFDGFYRLIGEQKDIMFHIKTEQEIELEKEWNIEYYENHFKIRKHLNVGLMSLSGEVIYEPVYRDIRLDNKYFFLMGKDGWGLQLRNGTPVLACKYSDIYLMSNGIFQVKRKGRYGYNKIDGTVILSTRFSTISLHKSLLKGVFGSQAILYEMDENFNLTDSLIFNQNINARAVKHSIAKQNLIQSKDTLSFEHNKFGFRYSKMYGCYLHYYNKNSRRHRKYADIWRTKDSNHYLVKVMRFKKKAKFKLDDEYSFNYRYGVLKRPYNKDLAASKYCGIALDELSHKKTETLRAINTSGKMVLITQRRESEPMTYIDAANSEGYRRYNIGGTYQISDYRTPYTIGTQYKFKKEFQLLTSKSPINVDFLKSKYVNIIGGEWGIIDKYGNFNATAKKKDRQTIRYDYVEYGDEFNFIATKDNKCNIVTFTNASSDLKLNQFQFKSAEVIHQNNSMAFVVQPYDSLYGYINSKGKSQLAPTYTLAMPFYEQRAFVQSGDQWMLLDTTFQQIGSPFVTVSRFHNGTALVENTSKEWHLINKDGENICDGTYFNIYPMEGKRTWALRKGGWRILDQNGKEVNDKRFAKVSPFFNGLAFASEQKGDLFQLVNNEGELISKNRYSKVVSNFNKEGYALVKSKKHHYLIDRLGEKLLNIPSSKVISVGNQSFIANQRKKPYLYTLGSRKLKWNHLPNFGDSFHNGLIRIRKDKLIGFVNRKGHSVIKPTYTSASIFAQNRAFVTSGTDSSYVINTNGEHLFAIKGKLHSHYSHGFAIIKNEHGFQYIDTLGNLLTSLGFERALRFRGGKAKVRINQRWNLLDLNGDLLLEKGFLQIEKSNSSFLPICEWNGFGLCNNEGTLVTSAIYHKISKVEGHDNIYRIEYFDNTFYYNMNKEDWLWKGE